MNAQQPDWPDAEALAAVTTALRAVPPLVIAPEIRRLQWRLAAVARGEAFLLQGGDCAETFDSVSLEGISAKVATLRQISLVLSGASAAPVVTVARMAGQYAKPRSKPLEVRGDVRLPAYRGDAVNGIAFEAGARRPDPSRLLGAYRASAMTLNLLRALLADGFPAPRQARAWTEAFLAASPSLDRYRPLVEAASDAGGAWPVHDEIFVCHEGLLLDYEAALIRSDQRSGQLYAASGHMLWIGERTRDPDGAHVALLSRVSNPVGVKIGPTAEPEDVAELVRRLDPRHEPGRLTLIVRMGAPVVRRALPRLVESVAAVGAPVVWVCDPMHGNTFEAPSGHKTRRLDDIIDEITGFFEVHRLLGTHPGGIHLEMTGEDVTECLGGAAGIDAAQLPTRYESACDPRLNRAQALEVALVVAELLGAGYGSRLAPSSERAVTPSL